jgi:hypothetical protein
MINRHTEASASQSSPPHGSDVMPTAAAATAGCRTTFDLERARRKLLWSHHGRDSTCGAPCTAYPDSCALRRLDAGRRPPPWDLNDGPIPATFVNGAGPARGAPPPPASRAPTATVTPPPPPPLPEYWAAGGGPHDRPPTAAHTHGQIKTRTHHRFTV